MPDIFLSAPGDSFWNAFLTGNGHMGQALSLHPENGRIALSHITYYSGRDEYPTDDASAPQAFRLAREAALRGDWAAMSAHTDDYLGRKGNYGTSLPVGELLIEQRLPGGWTDYARTLDLTDGVASCTFRHSESLQKQTAFCSHADRVFVLLLEDDAPVSLRIRVEGNHLEASAEKNQLFFHAQALETKHSDGCCGVKLQGLLQADSDGQIAAVDGALQITGAKRVCLMLAMTTDFDQPLTAPVLPDHDYKTLLQRHRDDFSALMNRAAVHLPTDPLSERMIALGRYLMVSGAREDSPLPMSLQGVWNDNVACNIGWTCDMHLDVNTQMNYWLAGTGNLPDCRQPLFRWMEERLSPHGRANARCHYGLPGWAAELVSNAWGWAQPYWHRSLSPCPACGAWEAADYMEHYRFTQDRAFLQEHVLPVLTEAADFFLAYLCEQDGFLVGGPSISPENAYLADGKKHFASMNATFETASIRQLFMDLQEARTALMLSPDERITDALDRLPPHRITPDGLLAEWPHDLPVADPQHRHMSHLIGVFPYGQITPEDTPELAQAARESIRRRLDPYDNWEDTGWARTMLAMYAARLMDGDQLGFHLREMQRILTVPNGLVMHPSTRGASSYAPVWELDGNTGFAAAALEGLLQSHGDELKLLPALPPQWQEGRFTGLKARGNITVDACWQDGRLISVTLSSPAEQTVHLRWQHLIAEFPLIPDVPFTVTPDMMMEVD